MLPGAGGAALGAGLLTTTVNILVRSQLERENTGIAHGWQGRPTDEFVRKYPWAGLAIRGL
jgi:hypothetical protein